MPPDQNESLKDYLPTKQDVYRVMRHLVTRDRLVFALGLALLGWALVLILQGDYSLWLGATVFLGGCIIHEVRLMPVSRDDARIVMFGERGIVENVLYTVGLIVPAFITANLADVRIMFSILLFLPIFGLYIAKVLPEHFPYQRMKDVPVVNDAIIAFGAALFLVSSVLFFNQIPSSSGMILVLLVITLRFFIGFTLPDIGAEKEREDLFADARPPANMPEQFGSNSTQAVLMILNTASFVLFGSLIAVNVLRPLAAFSLLSYLFAFVFIYFTDNTNVERMAATYWVLDTHIFFLFTVIGWASFMYGAA